MFEAKLGEEDRIRGERAISAAFGMFFAGKPLASLPPLTCWAPPPGLTSGMFGEFGLSLARAKRKLMQTRAGGVRDAEGAGPGA